MYDENKNSVSIRIGMRVSFPKRLNKNSRELLKRAATVRDALMQSNADLDISNLADVLDSLESLVSISRRAKASAHNRT